MNNLLRKTRDALLTKQNGIISSTLIIASMMMVARVFGFARYRVLNGYFPIAELDVFYAAFRVPDFVFEVLITGALTTTFIPFYLKHDQDKKKQSEFTSSLLNVISLALCVLIIVLFILMPWIVGGITKNFTQDKLDQVVFLSRLLLLGQLPFLVMGNMLTGLSQANRIFFVPALAPVLYNLSIVVATYLLAPTLGLSSTIIGVVFGAFLFFLSQLTVMKRVRFEYIPTLTHWPDLKHFFKIVIPRIMTVMAAQTEATIDLALASLLSQGSYTIFYLAQHLQLLPVSIIGISFGQASLPYLTEIYQGRKFTELKNIIVDTLNNIIFLTAPVAGFFIVNRTPIVRLIYGGSKFDWDATSLTAMTMSFFCFSLPFHSVYYFVTRCYYASMDSKTPFIVSVLAIAFNSVVSYYAIAVLKMPVWALGLTFSVTIAIQVMVLFFIFTSRINGFPYASLFVESAKVTFASGLSSLVAYDSRKLLDGLIFDTSRTINLFFLMTITFAIMMVTYFFAVWTLDSRGLFVLSTALAHLKSFPKKISTFFSPSES